MSKFDLPPVLQAPLPQPPASYDQAYMFRLVSAMDAQLQALRQPRNLMASGITTFDMPTAATGLRTGEVYLDGDTLKVAP